jgi:hypothetical protein
MSRTRVHTEDLFCARCGRVVRLGAATGPRVTSAQGATPARRGTYQRCAGCGVARLTPGIAPDGSRWCTDCGVCVCVSTAEKRGAIGAGSAATASCRAAGSAPGRRHRPHPARTRPVLRRSRGHAALLGRADLDRHTAHPADPKGALGRGEVPLTHDGRSALSPWRSVTHVRTYRWVQRFTPLPFGQHTHDGTRSVIAGGSMKRRQTRNSSSPSEVGAPPASRHATTRQGNCGLRYDKREYIFHGTVDIASIGI